MYNIPPSVSKIIIKKQINVFTREHRIPYNCELIIENTTTDMFDNVNEKDYLDITIIKLNTSSYMSSHKIIFNFTNLLELDLSNKCFLNVPDNICLLKNLKILRMSHNLSQRLPNNFGNMTSLQILDLSYGYLG